MTEKELMNIKRGLKARAKKLHLGKKRSGAYVFGTLRKIQGNPKRCWQGYAPVKGMKPYSKGSCRKVRGNPAPKPDDQMARELLLFIDNDEILLNRRYPQFVLNLERKMKRGVYDRERAVKLFMYLADEASKRYSKQFGDGKTHTADVPTRMLLAKMLRDRFESERRAVGIPAGRMPRMNPAQSFSDFREFLSETLIPDLRDSGMNSTADDFESAVNYLTYGKDRDYPKWKTFITKTLVPDLRESGYKETAKDFMTAVKFIDAGRSVVKNPVAPSGYHYMPDGRLMADSAHRMNPPPLFKNEGFMLAIHFTDGAVQLSPETAPPYSTRAKAERAKKYFLDQDKRIKLTRGKGFIESIEVLPTTRVLKNPPLSSHGMHIKIKRTHGLSLAEMRALYKLVKRGNGMADAYARKKLEVPRSESKYQLLAVIDHHIRDLAGR